MRIVSRALAAAAVVTLTAAMTACSGGGGDEGPATTLRLGYFPNVTHAPAIVADRSGYFAEELGGTSLEVVTFPNGPAAMEALRSGAVDATYVGPGPAASAFLNSDGEAIRVVAGATHGGSALVVAPEIDAAEDLRGKNVATPQLGNTQDIALRQWLKEEGFETDLQGGGDVHVTPVENSAVLDAFRQGSVAGAWVPEPFVARLVDAGGKVLVDERDLWTDGEFPTTVLSVRPDFAEQHPETVSAVLRAQLRANDKIESDPEGARRDVNALIESVSGKGVDPEVLEAAWQTLSFSVDPLESAIATGARHSYDVGILRAEPDLEGLVDLTLLDAVLEEQGRPSVSR